MVKTRYVKYLGKETCQKCGKEGYAIILEKVYVPKTDRFKGERRYRYKAVLHRNAGKSTMCYTELVSKRIIRKRGT